MGRIEFLFWGHTNNRQVIRGSWEYKSKVVDHGAGRKVTLIGYSQGAAVALLLGAALKGAGVVVHVVVLRGQYEASASADASLPNLNWDFPVTAMLGKQDRQAPLWASKGSLRQLRDHGCSVTVMVEKRAGHVNITQRELMALMAMLPL